ncbi:MAG: hypothetical protein BWY56_00657 [Acidobacteria bacterium ADurb.Bin340]|nr:MAG: hypothetical protein BWY56_00657 [Acidobacteria bacterium ADurb.Bin340]
MAHGADEALALAAALVGAVEDGQMLRLQVGRAFHGHGARQGLQEAGGGFFAEGGPQAVHGNHEAGVEGCGELLLPALELGFSEALGQQLGAGDAGGLVGDFKPADHVALDVLDLLGGVAQAGQGLGDGAVHELEVAAARQLLELHQGEIRLDARGVAVHEQADGACGSQHRNLGIAEAVLFAQSQGAVPAFPGGLHQGAGHAGAREALGRDGQAFVFGSGGVVGGPAVVAHHPQHVALVPFVAGEGAQLGGHLGAGGIGIAREDGGERRAPLGADLAVVGNAQAHEQGAQVGVAQAQGAEVVAEPRDGLAGELGHEHAHFEHHGPEADAVAVALQVEATIGGEEGAQVQGGQIAGRVIQEHVLGAGIARVDAAILGAGVPVVDGGVELQARIGAGPGGVVHLGPEVPGAEGLGGLAVDAPGELPVAVPLQGPHEGIGHSHGVVGVLASHRGVALAIPGGVVGLQVAVEVPLGQTAQTLGQEGGGHALLLGVGQGLAQLLVAGGIRLAGGGAFHGLAQRIPVARHQEGARGHHGHLPLLLNLPVNEGFDVRVVQIEGHHLGGPARGAAALDGARGPVAHCQEAHEAGAAPPAGKGLLGAPDTAEVAAGAGAVLEDAGFAHPQIHDAAGVHQVVLHALDEAGVGLGALVGGGALLHLAVGGIHVEVALGGTGDAVGEVQARVEPLGAVGGAHLVGQHVHQFVVEGLGILGCVEVAAGFAPEAPAPGEAVEDLPGVPLAAAGGVDAFAAEVLLGQDVHRHLGPALRHHHILGFEDHGAVQLADAAGAGHEGNAFEGIVAGLGEVAGDLHGGPRQRRKSPTGRAHVAEWIQVLERSPWHRGDRFEPLRVVSD